MALQRLSLKLRQMVTHSRCFHNSGRRQQQKAVAALSDIEPLSIIRSPENDPACQSEKHLGQYYTMPSSHVPAVFPQGLRTNYPRQIKTFNEACVMIRQPALEVISCLKKADYSKPPLRFIFYGWEGSGKTLSLCHSLHYCYTQGWVVLHVPNAFRWVTKCKDLPPSSHHKSRFDQPYHAVEWLRHFKIINESFLSKIKVQQRYTWTKREFTEEGSLLGQLVDQGISRVKSSSDVVGAVMKELRLQSGNQETGFRLAVAVDGVNALWGKTTITTENKRPVDPEELTLVYNLRKLMKNDWIGGAVITTLSQTRFFYISKSSYLPQELLGEKGFDSMDPFIPVSVSNYSEKEFESCYLYYMDRNWLQHPQSRTEEGKKELIFLSNRNPAAFEKLCDSL